MDLLRRALAACESIQVELQGQYSVARLQQFMQHVHHTRLLVDVVIAVATPVPCIVLVVVTDIARLSPPEDGIYRQTLAFWMRVATSTMVFTVAALVQLNHISASLSISPLQIIQISLSLTVVMTAVTLVHAIVIGFPVPFGLQLATPWWQLLLTLSLWRIWKRPLRESEDARLGLVQFAWYFGCTIAMSVVYPVLLYLFSVLQAYGQVVITGLLPFVKLGFRNWASYGAYRVEDLAPIVVTFSVDISHALSVSCAMQRSSSYIMPLMTMGVDVVLGCLNVYEVRQALQRAMAVAREIRSKDTRSRSSSTKYRNVIEEAIAIMDANAYLTECCASIALPRHLRSNTRARAYTHLFTRRRIHVAVVPHANGQPRAARLSRSDQLRAKYVQHILRLLHMVEFYLLIEFAEVVVAIIYSAYLAAMSRLPNRMYYQQLKTMTDDQVLVTLYSVLTYAGLELLTFLILTAVLTKLLGFPVFRVLAFALQKHWLMVQSLLCFYVFCVIHLSLEHFGSDYTFQFKWLHHSL